MEHLTIYRRIFYNSQCYKEAPRQQARGVQVHSTGANNPWLRRYVAPDDGRIGKNAYNNHHNQDGNVCASAYIGKQSDGTVAVYQTLPWDTRCWLSGSGSKGNANRLGYIGFEICEDAKTDEAYYRAAMRAAALLTAYLCQEYGIDPETGVHDHRELHEMGLASDHGDILHWQRNYGENMDSFRGMVMGFLALGVEAEYIDCDEVSIMYQAKAVNPGLYLNLRSGKSKTNSVLAKIPQGATVDVIDDTDPEWWRVRYQEQTGFAMAAYLDPIEQTPPEEPAAPEEPNEPEAPEAPETPAAPEDQKLLSTVKLKEIEACLADALSVIRAALGKE